MPAKTCRARCPDSTPDSGAQTWPGSGILGHKGAAVKNFQELVTKVLQTGLWSPGDDVLEWDDGAASGGGERGREAGVDDSVFSSGEEGVFEEDAAGLDGDRGGVYAHGCGVDVELPLREVVEAELVGDRGIESQSPAVGRQSGPRGTGVEGVRRGRES